MTRHWQVKPISTAQAERILWHVLEHMKDQYATVDALASVKALIKLLILEQS